MQNNKGLLIVISGPSGAGKGTICKALLEKRDDLFISVSATTRSPRAGEVDGVNYHFLTKEDFISKVESNDFFEALLFLQIVRFQKLPDVLCNVFRCSRLASAHFIGQLLIFTNRKPALARIAGAALERAMQQLDERFADRLPGLFDHQIDALEMVRRFHNVIHIDRAALHADGVRLIDIARLVMRQPTAFDMVGVVGQLDLYLVIDAALYTAVLFRTQYIK